MATEIIKMGYVPRFVQECPYCHTVFSYHKCDVYKLKWYELKKVRCPHCDVRSLPTYKAYIKEKEDGHTD